MDLSGLFNEALNLGITSALLIALVTYVINQGKKRDEQINGLLDAHEKHNVRLFENFCERERIIMAESAQREELIRREASERERIIRNEAKERESILWEEKERVERTQEEQNKTLKGIAETLSEIQRAIGEIYSDEFNETLLSRIKSKN